MGRRRRDLLTCQLVGMQIKRALEGRSSQLRRYRARQFIQSEIEPIPGASSEGHVPQLRRDRTGQVQVGKMKDRCELREQTKLCGYGPGHFRVRVKRKIVRRLREARQLRRNTRGQIVRPEIEL